MSAIESLAQVIDISPKSLEQTHDLFKLLGLVLSQKALLDIVSSEDAEDKDRVAAARVLTSLRERPEDIAERLRRSPFANMTIDQLHAIVQGVRDGKSLNTLITEVSNEQHAITSGPRLER